MFRPWLWLPAKLAHDVAPLGLDVARIVSREVSAAVHAFEWKRKNKTVFFRNPLGIAGGVDKDGTQIDGWRHFGAGFVEIGTVTPRPQLANPGRIIARDVSHSALWNKMGFPGHGAHFVRSALRDFRFDEFARRERDESTHEARFPVFVNIGKQRNTPLASAGADYTWLIDFFSRHSAMDAGGARDATHDLADAFVINISSPNTQGLRELFSRDRLRDFLGPIAERLQATRSLGLLKLSPDMDDETLQAAIDVTLSLDLDGFVATNTTSARPDTLAFPADGGLSGAPLRDRSREVLKNLMIGLGSKRQGLLVVSVGGVLSGDEALERLKQGADLVQTYSGLVFHGPSFFDRALRELACFDSVRPLV